MKSQKTRFRFRLPPALFAVAAVFLIGASILAADPPAAAPPAQADAAPAADAKKDAPSYLELYKKGGFFMIPLTLCSVLAIAIIIERFISLRRSVVMPPSFLSGLKGVWRDPTGDREAAINYCNQFDSAISRMVVAGIKRMPRGLVAAEKAVEDAGANEAIKLRRNMRFLYALGSVATLLGLIGTISGMIKAFQSAAGSASGNADVHALTTGIYEAMVNTFGGLAVAIVVTVFYYFFVGRIEKLITDMNDSLSSFSDEYGFNAESEVELRVTQTL